MERMVYLERLLSPEEVAERFKLKPKTVREWLRTGKLRGVKVGRLWRIEEKALEEFLRGIK